MAAKIIRRLLRKEMVVYGRTLNGRLRNGKAGKRGGHIERAVRAKTIISGQPIGRCFIHLLKVIYPIFVRFKKVFPDRPIEAFIDGRFVAGNSDGYKSE